MSAHFICMNCEKEFTRKSNFERHFERQIPCKKKKIVCPNCITGFTSIISLNFHMKNNCIENTKVKKFGNKFKLFLHHVKPKNFPRFKLKFDTKADFKRIMTEPITLIKDHFNTTYVKDIPYDKRTIWYLDISRNKFLIRYNNIWNTDTDDHKLIMKLFGDPIKDQIINVLRIFNMKLNNHFPTNIVKDKYQKYDIYSEFLDEYKDDKKDIIQRVNSITYKINTPTLILDIINDNFSKELSKYEKEFTISPLT